MGLFWCLGILSCGGIIFVLFCFIRKLIRCTVKVNAVICDFASRKNGIDEYVAPVYQFFYEGEEYKVQQPYYTKGCGLGNIGDLEILHIDPKNPKIHYNLSRELMDTFFTVVGLSVFVILFFST